MRDKTPEKIRADKEEFVAAREARHLTQEEWAKFLQKPYSSITKYESMKGPAVPDHLMRYIRTLSLDSVTFRLDDVMQRKLAKKLAQNGKTVDEYIADLLKAVLTLLFFFGCAASLFRWAETGDAAEGAMLGVADTATVAFKTVSLLASCGFHLVCALCS